MASVENLESAFLAGRPALTRFLRALLRSDTDAEDVLQDLWLKLPTMDATAIIEPLAYLYRTSQNLAFDRQRAQRRRADRESGWMKRQIGNAIDSHFDRQSSAERTLQARDYLRRVNVMIDGLPARTAMILRAVRIEGKPQKEIASNLGITLSAVEKHLQRAFRALIEFRRDNVE